MILAIPDTEITPIDIPKVQSGDPFEFQQLYRKFFSALVGEATIEVNDREQAISLVQLGCIQCWIRCGDITSEQYYLGYIRVRILRYAQALSRQEDGINQELEVLKEILSDGYAPDGQQPANLYGHLPLSQKALVRQVFKAYYQPAPDNPFRPEPDPNALYSKTLLNYALYTLHYILG
jgi:hypothetical protein